MSPTPFPNVFHLKVECQDMLNATSPATDDSFVHFCQLAASVTTLYDHILTFDLEVEYIWKRRWTHLKALFILARYFGDFLLISICVVFLNPDVGSTFCDVGLKFVGTGSMVVILITQVIMQLRIKAMYDKVMSRVITIFWILEVLAVLALGIASLAAIDVTPYTLQGIRMCNSTYLPPFAFLFWVPIIVFEAFLFSLALRMAYHNFLEIGSWRGVSLLHVVLRDNFIFFVIAFASYIITAATWLTANPRYFTVPGSFTCAFTTIMGCRLILNLCRVYYQPIDVSTVQPRSIWGASEGLRFRPPAVTAETTQGNWVEEEPVGLSSSITSKNSAGSPSEVCEVVALDTEKQ